MLSTVASTIQIAIAPVFLLAGLGAFLNFMVVRLARIVDRARVLEDRLLEGHQTHRAHWLWELRLLDRRMKVINIAIFLCVSSALAICLVVALLFVSELVHWDIGLAVALTFILCMTMLVCGLIAFLIEVRMSALAIRIRDEVLRQDN